MWKSRVRNKHLGYGHYAAPNVAEAAMESNLEHGLLGQPKHQLVFISRSMSVVDCCVVGVRASAEFGGRRR